MVIPEGYKRTEVGVIPKDWFISSLLNMCNYVDYRGKTPRKVNMGVFLVTAKNIKKGYIDYKSSEEYVDENEYFNIMSRGTPMIGDVLVTTEAPCGNIAQVDKIHIALAQRVIKYRAKNDSLDNTYLKYFMLSNTFQDILLRTESGGTVKGIKGSVLHELKIAFPDVIEQKNIAKALSDVDSMISSLEKLIAKKKAIKQGAMQELLTGKKRLPGFDGKWSMFVFCELFDFIPNNAFTRAQMSDNGNVKNIHYGDILTLFGLCIDGDNKSIPYVNQDVDLSSFSDRCYLQSGDIIIADTAEDETVGKALEVDNVNSLILAGQHTLLCRPKIKFADKFLGYYLNAECYHDQLLPFVVGTKVSSVSKSSVAQTKLFVPDFEEQNAIASILSDLDNEIDVLEQKLEKARQLKQGMMQQLLTGKIRLV